MFPFSSYTHIIRWGYRQKHASDILFTLNLTDPQTYEKNTALCGLREEFAHVCGRNLPDNHETYELWRWAPKNKPQGPIFVTFSDGYMIVHLSIRNQDGGMPSGYTIGANKLLPADLYCHNCNFTNTLEWKKDKPPVHPPLPSERSSGLPGYRCPKCGHWQPAKSSYPLV